ncbi:YceI family protein [Actinoallomurus rhizosphaericola]|uniref:YceI family protein n=1 Tax=Actinoallomurus rhizosphaericola TaxID=2952536 RepID=UPI002093EF95|nr:YceI family protein [Actinoallomurus rhizosphaericola]MCO5999671.1 YceI family protein [Actinoallomurus rhizosphaericola]
MTETAAPPGLTTGTWTIDPAHSEITFSIRHLMTTVRGSFTEFGGTIEIADDPFRSTATAEITIASIDTRNAERDAHVRSSEIMDVEHHPTMTFTATGVAPARTGRRARHPRYGVEGELTIRGITNPVRLLTEFHGTGVDPWGGLRAGFTASTRILRSEFGIQFNVPLQGDRLVLGDEIDIGLEIQAVLADD